MLKSALHTQSRYRYSLIGDRVGLRAKALPATLKGAGLKSL